MRVRIAALLVCLGLPAFAHAGLTNSLLDVSPDGRWLLAINNDNGTVTLIDVAKRAAVREIAVGAKPEGVTWIGNGPRAVATLYRESAVVFFNAQTGEVGTKLKLAAEPYGIVADPDGKRAWVTHEYPGIVSEIDLDAEKRAARNPGRRIRARHRPSARRRSASTSPNSTPASCARSTCRAARKSIPGRATRPTTSAGNVATAPEAAQGVSAAHPLDGQRQSRVRLDLSAAVDLRPQARRRTSAGGRSPWTPSTASTSPTNPWEVGHVARRQTAVRHLRRHQRHERLRGHRRRLPGDGADRAAAPRWAEPAGRARQPGQQDGVHLQRDGFRRHRSTTRTCGRRSPRSRRASRPRRRSGCAARFCSTPPCRRCRAAAGSRAPRAIRTAITTAASGRTPRASARPPRCSAWRTRIRCTGRPTATRCRISSTPSAAS